MRARIHTYTCTRAHTHTRKCINALTHIHSTYSQRCVRDFPLEMCGTMVQDVLCLLAIYIHIYINICNCVRKHTYIRLHARTHIHTHTLTQTHIHAFVYTPIGARCHKSNHPPPHLSHHTHKRSCLTHTHTNTHANIHTHKHTDPHTHAYTRTHTHAHTQTRKAARYGWRGNTLQHTATHCNTLQHTATHTFVYTPDRCEIFRWTCTEQWCKICCASLRVRGMGCKSRSYYICATSPIPVCLLRLLSRNI